MTPAEALRFLRERSAVDHATGCWVWARSLRHNGYGALQLSGRNWSAHRWAFHHLVHPASDSEVVHHTCGVRACVNPDHLQAVAHQDNLAEMRQRTVYLARISALEAEVARLTSVVGCEKCDPARPETGAP